MIQIGIIFLITAVVLYGLNSFKLPKDDNSKTTSELMHKYQKKDYLILFLFFILIPTFTIILSNFYNLLSDWSIAYDNSIIHIIKPEKGTWIGLALLASFGFAIISIFYVAKLLFKENANEYWTYYNRKYERRYGFKAVGILKYLGVILVLSSSVMVCLNLNSYVKFKKEKVEIKQLTDLETKNYELHNIKKIIHFDKTIAPNGNIVKKPHYAIVFHDNFIWRTNDNLRTPNKKDEEVLSFVADITGLKIEEMDIDQ